MSDDDRTKEERGQALGKEERNQKRRVETDSSNNLSEDRTKEERGQALGKRGKEPKKKSRNIVILTLIRCYNISVN